MFPGKNVQRSKRADKAGVDQKKNITSAQKEQNT